MSEDLSNEISAINSIYGASTIQPAGEPSTYILALHPHSISLHLLFPPSYPNCPPHILGTETTGIATSKSHASHVLTSARSLLRQLFQPGSVVLFDLIQDLDAHLGSDTSPPPSTSPDPRHYPPHKLPSFDPPDWHLSSPITEKKSLFLARACAVKSSAHAEACVQHLIANDKHVARATHNITAHRIRSIPSADTPQIAYQDCNDDGETAAWGRLLHLLQVMDVWGLCVVVSRWYGGVKLGGDRFRLIGIVGREAVVKGKWLKGGGREGEG